MTKKSEPKCEDRRCRNPLCDGKEHKYVKCTYCDDKGYASVATGGNIVHGDFVGDPNYSIPLTIEKRPCRKCQPPKYCICDPVPDNANHCKTHCWNEVVCDAEYVDPVTIEATQKKCDEAAKSLQCLCHCHTIAPVHAGHHTNCHGTDCLRTCMKSVQEDIKQADKERQEKWVEDGIKNGWAVGISQWLMVGNKYGYTAYYEKTVKDNIKKLIEKALETNSGGGPWRRILTQLLESLNPK